MKKKLMWAVGAICLIALIAGASVLYGKLSDNYAPDRLTQLAGEGSRGDQGAADRDDGLTEGGTSSGGGNSGSGTTSDEGNRGSGTTLDGGNSGSGTASDGGNSGNGTTSDGGNNGEGTASGEGQDASAENSVQQAPDFTVTDYDGEEVMLSDYFGKPIVVNFWASWCPPCKAEMPDFEEAYKTHSEVQFLMVNMTGGRETLESAKEHVESQGYTFTVLFDTEYSAAYAYYVNSLPATYFIDAEGNLIAYATGMLDAETLEKGIAMIADPDAAEAEGDSQAP
ncbi:MAG: TlpA disulfide reductase family protein [Acetatifactor sp.]|nr:TlpA disulfide reductase family protein [Acetatifactor sp.]